MNWARYGADFMAANEPEAATGFVEGWGFKISPGQELHRTGAAMLPSRHFARADTRSWFGAQDTCMCSGEIVLLIEIDDQPRLLRLPSQRRLGSRARGRQVHRGESSDPAEMRRCLFTRLGN